MNPLFSPSTTALNHDENEYILRVTNRLLSTMDVIEMKLKSFAKHVYPEETEFDNDENCEYQKPSLLSDWEYSINRQSSSIPEEKYAGDSISISSCKKEYFHDKNSMLAVKENQKTQPYETTYNIEPDLVNNIGVRSSISNNHKQHSESRSSLKNVNIKFHQSHADIQQPTSVRKSESVDNRDPEIPSATRKSPSLFSQAVEYHSGVWHMGRKGFVPPKTAPVAKTRKGIALFAGRVFHQGNLIPATISPEQGLAYYSWKGKVFSSNDFEICEIHNFAWEDEDSVYESLHGFPVGRTSDGKPLFLGRAHIEGRGPWVGSVDRDEKHIFIAFRGNELRIPQPYEVLVTY